MHLKIQLSFLFLLFASNYTYAADSTAPVTSVLTKSESFSQSNNNAQYIYSGATTGRVNYSQGFKQIIVNGSVHLTGTGRATYVELSPARVVNMVTCKSNRRDCDIRETPVTIPACLITITDTYTQGCSINQQYVSSASCYTSSNDNAYCRSGPTTRYQYSGNVRTVVGTK